MTADGWWGGTCMCECVYYIFMYVFIYIIQTARVRERASGGEGIAYCMWFNNMRFIRITCLLYTFVVSICICICLCVSALCIYYIFMYVFIYNTEGACARERESERKSTLHACIHTQCLYNVQFNIYALLIQSILSIICMCMYFVHSYTYLCIHQNSTPKYGYLSFPKYAQFHKRV